LFPPYQIIDAVSDDEEEGDDEGDDEDWALGLGD
jgi:hypothetical protein